MLPTSAAAEDDNILEIGSGISVVVLLSTAEETHCTYSGPVKPALRVVCHLFLTCTLVLLV